MYQLQTMTSVNDDDALFKWLVFPKLMIVVSI